MRTASLPVASLALLLTACPPHEEEDVTTGTGPPDASDATGGTPPAPEPPPAAGETGPAPEDPAMSCAEKLADVEAKLAACEAAKD